MSIRHMPDTEARQHMSKVARMIPVKNDLAPRGTLFLVALALVGVTLSHCSSSSAGVSCSSISDDAAVTQSASVCYPDNDGINGGSFTIDLVVDDTGFTASDVDAGAKNIITTQNDAQVTLTLTNKGTTPHGFEVQCTSVCPSYSNLPAGCSPLACFPANSTIAPIAPGASTTITFDTPTPDGLQYPFKSSEPSDSTVPGLNDGQWVLM
jgi:hypothetical protein